MRWLRRNRRVFACHLFVVFVVSTIPVMPRESHSAHLAIRAGWYAARDRLIRAGWEDSGAADYSRRNPGWRGKAGAGALVVLTAWNAWELIRDALESGLGIGGFINDMICKVTGSCAPGQNPNPPDDPRDPPNNDNFDDYNQGDDFNLPDCKILIHNIERWSQCFSSLPEYEKIHQKRASESGLNFVCPSSETAIYNTSVYRKIGKCDDTHNRWENVTIWYKRAPEPAKPDSEPNPGTGSGSGDAGGSGDGAVSGDHHPNLGGEGLPIDLTKDQMDEFMDLLDKYLKDPSIRVDLEKELDDLLEYAMKKRPEDFGFPDIDWEDLEKLLRDQGASDSDIDLEKKIFELEKKKWELEKKKRELEEKKKREREEEERDKDCNCDKDNSQDCNNESQDCHNDKECNNNNCENQCCSSDCDLVDIVHKYLEKILDQMELERIEYEISRIEKELDEIYRDLGDKNDCERCCPECGKDESHSGASIPESELHRINFQPIVDLKGELMGKFPFNELRLIPSSIEVLTAAPVAPSFDIPMPLGIDPIHIDLSMFDGFASFIRVVMGFCFYILAVFCCLKIWSRF